MQTRGSLQPASAGQWREGDDFKKISSRAAILFAPTVVGTIYGMNFDTMPELQRAAGYPFAILLMAVVCVSLYAILKKRDWLWPTAPARLVRLSVKSKSSARQGMLNRYSDTVPTRSARLPARRAARHGLRTPDGP